MFKGYKTNGYLNKLITALKHGVEEYNNRMLLNALQKCFIQLWRCFLLIQSISSKDTLHYILDLIKNRFKSDQALCIILKKKIRGIYDLYISHTNHITKLQQWNRYKFYNHFVMFKKSFWMVFARVTSTSLSNFLILSQKLNKTDKLAILILLWYVVIIKPKGNW